MAITRREFIEGVAVAGGATVVASGGAAAQVLLTAAVPATDDLLAFEQGSPYLLASHAPDDPAGPDEAYERLREEVIHFGMTPEERDRYLWGL
jgi:hypothetical protein